MTHPVRLFLATAAASALGVAALASPPAPSDNVLEIVIGSGPYAGTYKPPPSDTSCVHYKQQRIFAAIYKDFDASDPKKIGEAAINISNADEAGPKRGKVLVGFGKGVQYSVLIPGDSAGPITLTRNGKTADMAFQGRTKDGISIRMTAKCRDVEEF